MARSLPGARNHCRFHHPSRPQAKDERQEALRRRFLAGRPAPDRPRSELAHCPDTENVTRLHTIAVPEICNRAP